MALFVSTPGWSDETVNVNTATVKELQSVKGIGPKLAAAIVEHRDAHGRFNSVDELANVKGIGSKKLEQIRDKVRVDSPEASDGNKEKKSKEKSADRETQKKTKVSKADKAEEAMH